jgi:hypothetical protein
LTNLHKKAADSIVFCFTNCRGTFYRPGDTLPSLKALLKDLAEKSGVSVPLSKSNYFCFDNEAFRFLAALKQGIQFSDEDKKQFSVSWSQSVAVTEGMINYILKCPVHKVNDTITLNHARSLIMALSKPIAEISQNIQLNIKLANDKKEDLTRQGSSIDDLKDRLNIPQVDLEPVSLAHPRTVCTQSKCTKIIKFRNIDKTDYVTHCHPHCYLEGVATGTANNPDLRRCDAMVNGICKVCGCPWTTHMHITYENKYVHKTAIDENVQKIINEKKNANDAITAFLDQCRALIKELEAEQEIITKTSAKLAYFIRKNAIAVFNDDLEKYLELLIQEEEKKRSAGSQNASVIDGLRKMKESYKEQQRIFAEADAINAGQEIQLNEIPNLIRELYSLKHNGQQLKRIVDELQNSQRRVFTFKEEKYNIDVQMKNKKDNKLVETLRRINPFKF